VHWDTRTFLPPYPSLEEVFGLPALTHPSHWKLLPFRRLLE